MCHRVARGYLGCGSRGRLLYLSCCSHGDRSGFQRTKHRSEGDLDGSGTCSRAGESRCESTTIRDAGWTLKQLLNMGFGGISEDEYTRGARYEWKKFIADARRLRNENEEVETMDLVK